jgi:hypothetical protein
MHTYLRKPQSLYCLLCSSPQHSRLLFPSNLCVCFWRSFTLLVCDKQYRDLLRKEQSILAKQANPARDAEIIERAEAKHRANRTFCEGLTETKHLYDIGRSQITEFDPKHSRDKFYTFDINKDRRMGEFRTMAQDIGDGAWKHKVCVACCSVCKACA